MKAEDLMTGDWVKISHLNKIGKVYRIDRANGKGNGFAAVIDGDYSEDNLKPIPLTPKILEKNGWEERPTGYVFYIDEKRYDNSLWYIFGSNTFVVNTAEFQIKYVHELQHILRLCGIEKEIIL